MNIFNKIFFKFQNIRSFFDIIETCKTFIYSHLLQKKVEWNIGYIRTNWKGALNTDKITKITNSKNCWFADPFVIKEGKFNFIFFEDYSLIKKKGSISCIRVDKRDKKKYFKKIIKEKFHLSFPFTFKYKRKYYIIPESSADNCLRLYQCIKFPNKWKFIKKIIKNINCVDPVVFKWKNDWILLVSKQENKFLYNKLHVYKSKSPISSNWKPLSSNPVLKSNILGRNGGLIQESSKKIYRISQAYLPGNYGAFISINKVLNIKKNNYYEKKGKNILLNFEKNIKGVHTLNNAKNFTVFDYSKWKK